jgi:hypothetical protein
MLSKRTDNILNILGNLNKSESSKEIGKVCSIWFGIELIILLHDMGYFHAKEIFNFHFFDQNVQHAHDKCQKSIINMNELSA